VSGPVPPGPGTLYFVEVSIFFDLFNPNNRNRTEELRRLENTREEEGQGEPGRGPIDLNSGTVLIRVPNAQSAAAAESEAGAGNGPDTEAEDPENDGAAAPAEEDGGV
jgi:hypothetical protein